MLLCNQYIIGVIGGAEQPDLAQEIGAQISCFGHVVLTGGIPDNESNETTNRTPYGALLYAKQHSKSTARTIGILKDNKESSSYKKQVDWVYKNDSNNKQLLVYTHLSSFERNVLNGSIPHALIALQGSKGTLSEIGFARVFGKPVVFADSVDFLRNKMKYRKNELDDALNEAYLEFPTVAGHHLERNIVITALSEYLNSQKLPSYKYVKKGEHKALAKTVVTAALDLISNGQEILFPGIKHSKTNLKDFSFYIEKLMS